MLIRTVPRSLTCQVMVVKLYSLANGSEEICEVSSEIPDWLAVKPRLSKTWLRELVASALKSYFSRSRDLRQEAVFRS